MNTRALLLALPVLALAACTRDNRGSIELQAICSPPTSCTFSSACDAQYIGPVIVDATAAAPELPLVVQVENQLADNAGKEAGRVNTNDAHIDEISVSYSAALPSDTFPANGFVGAGTSSVVAIYVIRPRAGTDAALAAFVAAGSPRTLVANVRLRGYYDDGSRFETGEYSVAINVCSGCVGVPVKKDGTACTSNVFCPPGAGFFPQVCVQ
jgi:hypothetical protein